MYENLIIFLDENYSQTKQNKKYELKPYLIF
jgi:hypothetical protein